MCAKSKDKQFKKTLPGESDLMQERTLPHTSGACHSDPGGASYMTYQEQIKDPRWQKKRLEILDRDKFTCRICKDKTSELNVHHIFYDKERKIWEYSNGFLITLCTKCHETIHISYIDALIMATLFIEEHGFEAFEKLTSLYQHIIDKK